MITLTRQACKSYTLTGDTVDATYNIKNLDGTLVSTGTITGNAQAISVPEEGVYIVEEDLGSSVNKYTLIEECELIVCLMKLMQKIFCKEPGNCGKCDSDEINAIRHELNKLFTGYGLFFLWIFAERVTSYGVYEIDSCRLEKLQMIDMWIDDLKEIKKRCGPDDCSGTNNSTDTGCSSC